MEIDSVMAAANPGRQQYRLGPAAGDDTQDVDQAVLAAQDDVAQPVDAPVFFAVGASEWCWCRRRR
jgi:hypothetical protein